MMPINPHIDIDGPDYPEFPDVPMIDAEGKYSEYQWAFRTNEKNPKITVFKKQGETSTELRWSIVPLNNERTLWVLPSHNWDYAASEYDLYYESDTCERYLVEAFLKSENFDKPFNGEQITYDNVTYNLVVDKYHDYISNIIYPDNTQYNIVDNNAVHLTGDETIYGKKTFMGNKIDNKIFVDEHPNIIIKSNTNYDTDISDFGSDYSDIEFDKANGTRIGNIRVYNSGKCGFENFNHVYAPASDVNSSIVTTINKSKTANGYFQLGNGLIINWGHFNNANNEAEFSFQKPFSHSDSYGMTLCVNKTASATSAYYVWTFYHTRTGFKIGASQTNNIFFWWIAIGY